MSTKYGRGSAAIVALIIAAILALALGVWGGQHWFGSRQADRPAPKDFPGFVLPRDGKLIPAFELNDGDGQTFDLSSLKGHWTLLFFGYTHCPDVCPTALSTLSTIYEGLEKTRDGGDEVDVVFVSVDPERDKPAQLKEYVGYFNPAFVGVTGEPDTLASFSRVLGAVYAKAKGTESSGYLVDHTAAIFLINPEGRYKAVMSPPHDAAKIIAGVDALRD